MKKAEGVPQGLACAMLVVLSAIPAEAEISRKGTTSLPSVEIHLEVLPSLRHSIEAREQLRNTEKREFVKRIPKEMLEQPDFPENLPKSLPTAKYVAPMPPAVVVQQPVMPPQSIAKAPENKGMQDYSHLKKEVILQPIPGVINPAPITQISETPAPFIPPVTQAPQEVVAEIAPQVSMPIPPQPKEAGILDNIFEEIGLQESPSAIVPMPTAPSEAVTQLNANTPPTLPKLAIADVIAQPLPESRAAAAVKQKAKGSSKVAAKKQVAAPIKSAMSPLPVIAPKPALANPAIDKTLIQSPPAIIHTIKEEGSAPLGASSNAPELSYPKLSDVDAQVPRIEEAQKEVSALSQEAEAWLNGESDNLPASSSVPQMEDAAPLTEAENSFLSVMETAKVPTVKAEEASALILEEQSIKSPVKNVSEPMLELSENTLSAPEIPVESLELAALAPVENPRNVNSLPDPSVAEGESFTLEPVDPPKTPDSSPLEMIDTTPEAAELSMPDMPSPSAMEEQKVPEAAPLSPAPPEEQLFPTATNAAPVTQEKEGWLPELKQTFKKLLGSEEPKPATMTAPSASETSQSSAPAGSALPSMSLLRPEGAIQAAPQSQQPQSLPDNTLPSMGMLGDEVSQSVASDSEIPDDFRAEQTELDFSTISEQEIASLPPSFPEIIEELEPIDASPPELIAKPEIVEPEPVAAIKQAPKPASTQAKPTQLEIAYSKDETDIPEQMQTKLRDLASFASAPESRIIVSAYAGGDASESKAANMISLARGLSLRAFLIEQGVPMDKIIVQAKGIEGAGSNPERAEVVLQ